MIYLKIIIKTKGLKITDAIENYLKNKINIFLKKYLFCEENIKIKCKLKVEKAKHGIEINFYFYSYLLRVETITKDMYESINEAFENLEIKYKKHKDRLIKKNIRKKNNKNINKNIDNFKIDEKNDFYKIIRRKNFLLKPMFEEEAILQMELLGHNFYIYLDYKSNNINIIYKRKENFYGIIETKK